MQTYQEGSAEVERGTKSRYARLRELIRVALTRLRRGELDRRKAVLSIACGVFVGMLPIYGFQTLVWGALALVLPVDPALSWAVTWVNNPFTLLPILVMEVEVGALLCTGRWQPTSFAELRHATWAATAGEHLAVGGVAAAVICAAMAAAVTHIWARRLDR